MRHEPARQMAVGLVLLLVTGLSMPVAAFENDFHDGLTKWLAIQAGIAEPYAALIAKGDRARDQGVSSAVHLMTWYVCLRVRYIHEPDKEASQDIGDRHFPTKNSVPKPPASRTVVPNSGDARRFVDPLIAARGSKASIENRLTDLGKALHPFQDSWSHQGVPDVPEVAFYIDFTRVTVKCDERYSWAHPRKRGGFRSHNADLTYLWPVESTEAARMTFEKLKAFAEANQWKSPRLGRLWPSLKADIAAFVSARTKTEKLEWFTARGFAEDEAVESLNEINLENGARRFGIRRRLFGDLPQPRVSLAQAGPLPEVTAFLEAFFKDWFTTTDYDRFMNTYVDSAAIAIGSGSKIGDAATIARVMFLMWRVVDHGLVTSLGHALPENGDKQFEELKKLTEQPSALVRFEVPPLLTLGKNREPFVVLPLGKEYVVFARLAHAPKDSIAIVIRKVTDPRGGLPWRVTGLTWMIEDEFPDSFPPNPRTSLCCR